MKYVRSVFAAFFLLYILSISLNAKEEDLFATLDSKKQFARDISSLIEKAWEKWQSKVVINNVYVDGSQGVLSPGDVREPVLTMSLIMEGFDRSGRSQDYIDCVRAVASAVENGMRLWQKGYSHNNIPFPQGASCVYTLPPSYNVPVSVATGHSAGEKEMTENALYNYMLYRIPYHNKDVLEVLRAAARAISECFFGWERTCCIKDILASGGVAPQPAPMGSGPGMVRGAKGNDGRLKGTYFDGAAMYDKMSEYFREQERAQGK